MITHIIIVATAITSIACFKNRELFHKLAMTPYYVTHKKEWYRVITHGFVHSGYPHLLINMFVLLSFGRYVEAMISSRFENGTLTYIMLYFGALIFASIPDIVRQKNNYYYTSIGASGAVTAVVFTSILFSPWSMLYFFAIVPIPAIVFGVLYLWYESYANRRGGGNINHSAHIYGAIFGFIYPIIMKPTLLKEFIDKLSQLNF